MRISVFDADSGGYAELASEPIPITVHPTREVTLLDVEGTAASGAANGAPSAPVASSREGIAHNYAGPHAAGRPALRSASLRGFARRDAGAVRRPAVCWRAFTEPLALRRFRQRPRRPAAALANLRRTVTAAGRDAPEPVLLAALRRYLGDSLRAGQAVHGFADVAGALRGTGSDRPGPGGGSCVSCSHHSRPRATAERTSRAKTSASACWRGAAHVERSFHR